jgi:NAD(P)H-dependent FMN reductase
MTRVVAVVGSLRDESHTRTAARHALEGVRAAGGESDLLDLREWDLPPLDPDADEKGDAAAFARTVREADAVVLATPMYHGSFSGVLKNALDHCGFDEFEGKTVGLLGVAGGSFPVTALEHLRSVCRALNAWVLPHQAAVPQSHSAFADGTFEDERLRDRVVTLGRRTVEYASIEPDPATFESEQNEGA